MMGILIFVLVKRKDTYFSQIAMNSEIFSSFSFTLLQLDAHYMNYTLILKGDKSSYS